MTNKQLNAEVLVQLLLMQSLLINLPDRKSIFSFVCKGLMDIPGVADVNYSEDKFTLIDNIPSHVFLPITLSESYYGKIILKISDIEQFIPYEAYLNNFVFMIAVILEERKHREQNQQHQLLLEERIRERTQELSIEKDNLIESQRRFTDLMTNINLLSVMLDKEGHIIFCNKYLLTLTQYTTDEIMGKNWFEIFLPVEIAEHIKSVFKEAIAGKGLANNYENEILTKTGDKLLILWNNTILRDGSRKIIGTASIGENITERKLAEEALIYKNKEYHSLNEEYLAINEELSESLERVHNINSELEKAKLKAEESDRLKTAFLQNMSHEIRTPMNAIMGFSELLASNYNNKPKLEKFAGIISRRCNDLLDIINDILDIAKIESGQLSVNYEECDLQELFIELRIFFKEFQNRMGKQQILFDLKPFNDHKMNMIVTDKGKLKQILINLLSNAFKYTETGNIMGGCMLEDQKLVLFVSDTGIGIPKDKQSMVFERFTRIQQSSGNIIGGTGLGLSIVKGLVNLLEGEIILKSETEKGSTFTLTLPYKTILHWQNKPLQINEPKEYHFDHKTILIVEDDLYNSEFLKEVLSETGFEIIVAQLGKEACKLALEKKPDLILMDIRLPDIDGYETTKIILNNNPKMKIIAQTAYASYDERKKAIEAGCCDYISKPTKSEILLSKINSQLE